MSVFPIALFFLLITSYSLITSAQIIDEDEVVDEPDEGSSHERVEPETEFKQPDTAVSEQGTIVDEFPDGLPRPHVSIESFILFIDPSHIGVIPRSSSAQLELPVGHEIKIVISARHVGLEEGSKMPFTFDLISGSIRYPMDYSYYIQNFTASKIEMVLQPHHESTFVYGFTIASQLTGRPYGITLRLFYHDPDGKAYVTTMMNETVALIDYEEPLGSSRVDTEAIFLYAVMAGLFILIVLGLAQLWQSYAPKKLRSKFLTNNAFSAATGAAARGIKTTQAHLMDSAKNGLSSKKQAENDIILAASNDARERGIDVDWLPKSVLLREALRKSPGRSKPKIKASSGPE